MKLATYRDGSRDGQLVVVSRDLASAHYATGIATRLQQVLDDWNFLAPQLQDLSQTLDSGKARHAFEFDPRQCLAPLPRAAQWVVASAYGRPGDVQAGAGEAAPAVLRMRHGAPDTLIGPTDPLRVADAAWEADFGAGLAVATGDVEAGVTPGQALEGVRLVMLVNEWSLAALEAHERSCGSGLVQSRPATAFAPVAATPDELGAAWDGGRVQLTVQTACNGRTIGACDAGADMDFHFGELIAHLALTRRIRAGSLVGSGVVANRDPSRGYASVADKRALERREHGEPRTPFLQPGDTVRIDMKGRDGLSVCGAIEQQVAPI